MIALLSLLLAALALPAAVDAKTLAGNGESFMYIQLDGQVFGHGRTVYGLLATGIPNGLSIQRPTAVVNVSNVTDITIGDTYSCLVDQGAAKCSGQNAGRLGNGLSDFSWLPVSVTGLKQDVVEVFANKAFSFAILANGTAMGWGLNTYGQLMDNTTVTTLVPVPILVGMQVKQIAATQVSACALTVGGKVYCAGQNAQGALGDGTLISRTTPMPVQGLSEVTASIAGGFLSFVCALDIQGLARCWGRGADAQLGTGVVQSYSALPTIPAGLENVVVDELVASQKAIFFILESNRSALVAGTSEENAFGTGASTKYYTAVPFAGGVTGIKVLAGGYRTTCIFNQADELWCVGDSQYYQLGQGDIADSPVLVRVQNMATRVPSASPTASPTLAPTAAPALPTVAPTTLAPVVATAAPASSSTAAPAASSSPSTSSPSTSAAATVVPGLIATGALLLAF
ncbi:hypothetical protein BASA81_016259 [Batrachochytrium salamandrivorans]|nr:hypothetical protein BASA81_016259 [Batrachochytrium salamandrivorans]